MKRTLKDPPLKYKLLAGNVAMTLVVGGLILLLVNAVLSRALLQELQKQGIAAARGVAAEALDPTLARDRLRLRALLADHKELLPDTAYAFVVDTRGEVLASTFEDGFPAGLKAINPTRAGGTVSVASLLLDGRRAYEVAVPLLEGTGGALHVGFFEQAIAQVTSRVLIQVAGVAALGLGLVVAFSMAFSAYVTRPLARLTAAARALGAGRVPRPVPVSGRDEIGELGESFNHQVASLARYRQRLLLASDYTSSIVRSMADALMVIDPDGRIKTVNHAACRLLGYTGQELLGASVARVVDAEGTVLEEIDLPALLVSRDFEILRANRAFQRELGHEEEALIGRRCHEVTHRRRSVCTPPDDRCPFAAIDRDGRPCVERHRHYDKDGHPFAVDVVGAPVKDASGKLLYYLHLARRVTRPGEPQAEQQEALALGEKLRRRLEACRTELARARQWLATVLASMCAAGTVRDANMVLRARSGERIPVSFSGAALRNRRGTFIGIVGVARDMREVERLVREQSSLARAAAAAAEKEHQRAAELEATSRALAKAKARAERVSRTKDRFLANMSHEIRTPMNAILGFLDLLRTTPLDAQQQDYLETIASSGHVLLDIVNDILDLSKVEAGQIQLECIPFDLEALAEDVFRVVRPRLEGKALDLFLQLAPAVPRHLAGDPTRLRQILLNLLANAIKFTERGEVSLEILLAERAPDGVSTLRFAVRDTGIGIPRDKQKLIFRPFTQVDESTTRQYGGTGLGLSICRAYVKLMGGDINVRSEPGRGSEFTFTAQFKEEPAGRATEEEPAAAAVLRGVEVLLVEDSPKHRRAVRTLVEACGMISVEAGSAPEARAWLAGRGAAPAVALIDVAIAGLDAGELARRLRAHPAGARVKLVAMTADVRAGVAGRLGEAGFDALLLKPVTRRELVSVIGTVLGGGGRPAAPAARPEEPPCQGLHILVAEDHPVNRKLIRAMLEELGAAVDVVGDGHQAVEKVATGTYDLVLMDLMMPVMSGLEATRRIREGGHKALPIVALTAAAMPEDREKSLAAGMNDFLAKPFGAEQLEEMIRKWTRRRPGAKSGAAPRVAIDREEALRRLKIPEALYDELLRDLTAHARDVLEKLPAAGERNLEETRRLAHYIKGSAASLRIEAVRGVAEALEVACRERRAPPEIEAGAARLEQVLTELIDMVSWKEERQDVHPEDSRGR